MPSKNRRTKLLTVWLDPRDHEALKQAARAADSDSSKLARAAIRELITRRSPKPAKAA